MTPKSKQTISKELREAVSREFGEVFTESRKPIVDLSSMLLGGDKSVYGYSKNYTRCTEDLLEFIAAREEKAVREEREHAIREVISGIRCGFPKAKNRAEHHHNMKVISWALDEIDEYLRAKFLPTSTNPETHEN